MTTTMKISDSELTGMMHKAGIRPSLQRLAVLSYVATGATHPSADQIFTDLSAEYPTMSRTTVYNSLHTLVEAGLLKELDFDSTNRRYDFAPQPWHGHFQCRRCGRVFDMAVKSDACGCSGSDGFEIDTVDVYYKGLCPDCHKENINL